MPWPGILPKSGQSTHRTVSGRKALSSAYTGGVAVIKGLVLFAYAVVVYVVVLVTFLHVTASVGGVDVPTRLDANQHRHTSRQPQ